MSRYTEMKKRHQEEVNAFPMFFAFCNERLVEGMQKLGVTDAKELRRIWGGGFMRESDVPAFKEMCKRHREELDAAIASDKTGDGFIYDMFYYELNNHEYCYTCDYEDTLNALGLTYEDLENNPRLKHGIEKAAKKICAAGGF